MITKARRAQLVWRKNSKTKTPKKSLPQEEISISWNKVKIVQNKFTSTIQKVHNGDAFLYSGGKNTPIISQKWLQCCHCDSGFYLGLTKEAVEGWISGKQVDLVIFGTGQNGKFKVSQGAIDYLNGKEVKIPHCKMESGEAIKKFQAERKKGKKVKIPYCKMESGEAIKKFQAERKKGKKVTLFLWTRN